MRYFNLDCITENAGALPKPPNGVLVGLEKMKNLDKVERWIIKFEQQMDSVGKTGLVEIALQRLESALANREGVTRPKCSLKTYRRTPLKRLETLLEFLNDMIDFGWNLKAVIGTWEKENKVILIAEEGPVQDILESLLRRVGKHFEACDQCSKRLPESHFPNLGCNHHTCADCLRTWAVKKAELGVDIHCGTHGVEQGCVVIPDDVLRDLLGDGLYDNWVKLKLKKAAHSYGGSGSSCEPIAKKIVDLKENMKKAAGTTSDCERRRMQHQLEELLTLQALKQEHTRECPKCHTLILHGGGCNKIRCWCNHYFCFDCLRPMVNHKKEACVGYQKGRRPITA